MNESRNQSIITVKLPCTGQRFVNGIASRYDDTYDPVLTGIISEGELVDVIKRLNDTIASYWPCNACYLFGYVCSPFTLGTSLLCPNYCVSQAEEHAHRMLENVSLKSKYMDRNIAFKIVKQCCSSYVEISFPSTLINDTNNSRIEENDKSSSDVDLVVNPIGSQPTASSISIPFPSFTANSNSSSGARLKGN